MTRSTRVMVEISALLAALALAGCPAATNPPVDGGGGGGGGQGNDSGVPDGGHTDDQCDFTTRGCDAGSSCVTAVLSDGGQARRCLPGPCDVITQDCSAGLKCAYGDGGRECLPEGTLAEGAACAGAPSGCQKGLVCTFTQGADGGSACARFCRLDGDCAPPQQCYVSLVLPDTAERPLVCAAPPVSCDPLRQDCPDAAQGCYPGSGGAGCFDPGAGVAGSGCVFSNDCGKGLACVGPAGATSCRQLCAWPSGSPACTAGTCTRLTSSMTIGVCL